MDSKNLQTALITGASSGIGLELARVFAREGFAMILVARNQAKLASLAQELQTAHQVPVTVLPADLGQPGASAHLAASLQEKGLQVDVLVNNAGTQVYSPFAEANLPELFSMLQVNVTALMELTRLLLPEMIKRGRGKILNLGSTGSYVPGPLNAVYCATKAFVLSFSEAIAAELDGTGVTVTTLCPGATQTEFVERHGLQNVRLFQNAMSPEQVAQIGYRALMAGKRTVVAGFANQFQILLFKLLGPFLPLFSNRMVMRMGDYFMGEVI
ncbi:MAG: SDR family oxidoreductase [Chloroflexi bacterium]|nr:SDR family oxidoreductase [Chloroflexota bacterium]